MTANERDPRVAALSTGAIQKEAIPILSAFSWEPLQAKLQDNTT